MFAAGDGRSQPRVTVNLEHSAVRCALREPRPLSGRGRTGWRSFLLSFLHLLGRSFHPGDGHGGDPGLTVDGEFGLFFVAHVILHLIINIVLHI